MRIYCWEAREKIHIHLLTKLWTSSQPFNLITTVNYCEFHFLFFSFLNLLLLCLQFESGKSYLNWHDSSVKSSKILPSTYGCKSAVVCKTSMIALPISSRALFDISCRHYIEIRLNSAIAWCVLRDFILYPISITR